MEHSKVFAALTAPPLQSPRECANYDEVWTHPSGAHLYVGNALASTELDRLVVGAIIALVYTPMDAFYLQTQCTGPSPSEERLFVWHLDDHHTRENTNILVALPDIFDFAMRFLDAGQSVLVHCIAGMSRSAAVAWAIMAAQPQADPFSEAQHLRARRPCASINPYIAQQVVDWIYGRVTDPAAYATIAPENAIPDALANVQLEKNEV